MRVSSKIEIVIGFILLGLTVILFFFGDSIRQEVEISIHQVVSEEDGRQKIAYMDDNGQPVNEPNKPYSIIVQTKDSLGRVIKEEYYDIDEQPISNNNGAYGICYEYDEIGNTVCTIYVDENGNPTSINFGFASIRRVFNENGTMRYAFFYDRDGNQTTSHWGEYGYYREYDDQKRIILNTFLDENGEPMVGTTGYASVVTSYDENTGKVSIERYLDQNGNPIALVKGQYGIKYVGDKTVFLDINGKEYFSLYSMFENYPYCALLVAFLVSVVALFTSKRFNVFLLILSLVFICYMTLMNRNVADLRTNFNLFWSYRQVFSSETLRLEVLNNIWLFIPVGTILYRLLGDYRVVLACILLSVAIEAVQYITGLGLCELDDVISNAIGGFIGYSIGQIRFSLPGKVGTQVRGSM